MTYSSRPATNEEILAKYERSFLAKQETARSPSFVSLRPVPGAPPVFAPAFPVAIGRPRWARPAKTRRETMKTERQDVYTQVTNTIIAAIEAGAGDWQMPWHRSGQGLNRPVNIDTANAYRGINVVSLWASAQARGFSTGTWGDLSPMAEQGLSGPQGREIQPRGLLQGVRRGRAEGRRRH